MGLIRITENHDYAVQYKEGICGILQKKEDRDMASNVLCGGKGHQAQICPSSRRYTKRQIRCYNCNQIGHILNNCPERPTGQALNYKGPVGRAKTWSQSFLIWLHQTRAVLSTEISWHCVTGSTNLLCSSS